MISPSGDVIVSHGSDQAFTITPDVGYMIVDVTVDGSSAGPVTSYNFLSVTSGHIISAAFASTSP